MPNNFAQLWKKSKKKQPRSACPYVIFNLQYLAYLTPGSPTQNCKPCISCHSLKVRIAQIKTHNFKFSWNTKMARETKALYLALTFS